MCEAFMEDRGAGCLAAPRDRAIGGHRLQQREW
jgi:hypothetical protein